MLAGKTMRMYVRISLVGNRKRHGDEGTVQGDRLLWSDAAQMAVGQACASEWGMAFDEEESRLHSDPDVSGYHTKWEGRRGLKAHYEDAKRGEFQVLGLHFADRIGRNVRETVRAIEAFLKLGILIYVAEDEEFIGEDDKDALNNLHGQMVAAEKFSLRLASRVRDAHRRRALSGLHKGGPPPAWLMFDKAQGRYVVIERAAEMMRFMVDLRLQGKSETAITRELNKMGPTPRGYPWRQCNVNRYLSVRLIEKMEGHSHFCAKGEEPILVPNVWDPILTPEKAAEIKRVLISANKSTYYESHFANKVNRRTRAVAAHAPFLLTGRVFCSVCGKRVVGMSGNKRANNARYVCGTALSTKSLHAGVQAYFRRHHVENAVLLALSLWLKTPPPPMPVAEGLPTESGQRQLKRLNEQIDELLDLYQAGTWSKEDYLRKHQDLVSRRDELRRRLTQSEHPVARSTAEKLAAEPHDRVRLRELVHLLVDRVELPVYIPGRTWGVRGRPRPYVRILLHYPMPDGATSLLSPICWDRYEGPREIIAE
jgi:DNA invertase Pin-like site-specific DNA recombinase